MGRLKFNEEITERLCTAHENGLPQKACASLCGIDRKTLYRWLKKGEEAKRGKYRDFYLKWQKANAKFQLYHLKKINDSQSWMASQYLLQVTDPDSYVVAEKQQIEANVEADVDAQTIQADLTDDKFMDSELEFMKKLLKEE